jgi:FkbM family methyltransferase
MYSQHEEEKHILEALGGATEVGNFLDVGAWNGKTFSNTLRLVELGWRGVLVEPSPGPFHELLALHRNKPSLRLVNAAVAPTADGRPVRFYLTDDAVSTSSEQFMQVWSRDIDYQAAYVIPISAEALVAFCIEQGYPPAFVNVDTEGTSYEITLALYQALRARSVFPKAWCVEHQTRYKSFQPELVAALSDYQITYTSPENTLFVRSS